MRRKIRRLSAVLAPFSAVVFLLLETAPRISGGR
jgi:hypothetical protein